MRLIEQGCPSEVDHANPTANREPVTALPRAILLQPLPFQQNVFRLEIGVSVAETVEEAYTLEDLAEEGLDEFHRETLIVVFLDEFEEGKTQRLEDHAEVAVVVEGTLVAHDAFLVLLIPSVNRLYYVPLCLGRLHVLLNWSDDLV